MERAGDFASPAAAARTARSPAPCQFDDDDSDCEDGTLSEDEQEPDYDAAHFAAALESEEELLPHRAAGHDHHLVPLAAVCADHLWRGKRHE